VTHPERARDYLEHIADAIERARRYAGRVKNLQGLEKDQLVQDAIVRALAVIGEAAGRMQKVAPEFVAAHPEVPWSLMRGMRNKIIHDYFDVAWDVVWNTIQRDLPPLLKQINTLLQTEAPLNGAPIAGLMPEASLRWSSRGLTRITVQVTPTIVTL